MQSILMPNVEELADVDDIEDDDGVDALGVLRAVVGAWQSLIVDNDAASSD